MCTQVHVWEDSACIFNVAFYRNESDRGCAARMLCVHLFYKDDLVYWESFIY